MLWVHAVRWAVKKFRYYLVESECTVFLPNKALIQVYRQKELHPKV